MSGYFRKSPRHSWHRFVTFTRGGPILARCGYRCTNLTPELSWSDDPPINEKGCESCARLTLHDEAGQ